MVMRPQTSRDLTVLDPATGQITSRGMLILVGLCFASTLLCVWLVDRTVATYAHHYLRVGGKEQWYFKALTDIPDLIPVVAGLVTAWYAGGLLFGVRPGPRGRVALQAALAVLVAITLKEQLKVVAGRTWPETWTNNNPSWIKDGVYGFFPLQSLLVEKTGRAYFAFPSGHMTIIAVAMASLTLNAPRFAWLAPIPVLLVAIGMVGANYHWVSDLIFGAFLGAGVALAAYRLDRQADA